MSAESVGIWFSFVAPGQARSLRPCSPNRKPHRRGRHREAASTLTTETAGLTEALRDLEIAAAGFLPLAALAPVGYAAKHARFEARSDQRALITEWLVDRVREIPRAEGTFRVLSIGCGDGSVDVEVARTLAASGPVDYRGIEPHAPSAALFETRLASLDGVTVTSESVTFDAVSGNRSYDLIIAVHSLYYVRDLRQALTEAHRMLAPGGRLIVLHAPRERLNRLVGVLAPGRTQEFSDAVSRAIETAGWQVESHRIEATLDLDRRSVDGDREWRDILDFTVQAVIPDELIGSVEHALRAAATRGLFLAHPVDAFIVT